MGLMDKAKKLAEQAQEKLDEVQKQFNESQAPAQSPQQAPVDYDQHGRPVVSEAPAQPAPPAANAERRDEYAPPKLTDGDPLAG